jgi:hypothetical protein
MQSICALRSSLPSINVENLALQLLPVLDLQLLTTRRLLRDPLLPQGSLTSLSNLNTA